MKGWWIAVVLVVSGCSTGSNDALALSIRIEPGVKSTHAIAFARGGDHVAQTKCMEIGDEKFLEVAVLRGKFPADIELWASGFSDDACAQPTEPAENATPIQRTFITGKIVTGLLVLRPDGATVETDCADDVDDDGDGLKDCLDPDCDGQTCQSTNLCITGAVCVERACQGGTQVTCDSPPSCFQGAGLCVAEVGCRYLPDIGQLCDDEDPCTPVSQCTNTGACTGPRRVCDTPPPGAECLEPIGACVSDGGCEYEPAIDAGCSDRDNCTIEDHCDDTATCIGRRVECPPRECGTSSECTADGGCIYEAFAPGSACSDGGVCNTGATCLPPFPFVPSHFEVKDVPTPPAGKVTYDCGVTEIDTGVSGAPTVINACAGQPPLSYAEIVQSSVPTLVLAFEDLEIAGNNTLRFIGQRPVIVVSLKDIRVFGAIDARAGAQACVGNGAGGNGSSGSGWQSGGGGGGFGSAGARGGHAGSAQTGTGGAVNGATGLRGGCPGGRGGNNGDAPGSGGGAIQLVARQTLFLGGVINAPGEGGPGGGAFQAGGGGGSGGAIFLEAERLIATNGVLACNGGGGGQQTVNNRGDDGQASANPAPGGGAGGVIAGQGGNGAAGTTAATAGGDASALNFGGGGGGGVGRIHINVATLCDLGPPVVISPPATSNRPDAGCP